MTNTDISRLWRRRKGVFVSGGGVRSIWLRHDLETFKKRLHALSVKVAQEGLILTQDQLRALERAQEERQACGEIESEHPGYYCKVAWVKLYDRNMRSRQPTCATIGCYPGMKNKVSPCYAF